MSNLVIDDLRIQRSAKPDHRKGREGRKGKKFNLLEVPLRVFARCWYSIGKILTLGAEGLCDGNDRHQHSAKPISPQRPRRTQRKKEIQFS
jgi:hypothetical protein